MAHRIDNDEQHEYLRTVSIPEQAGVEYDLAIVEFDDQGMFWKLDQFEDTLALIKQRNAESERGVFVIPFVHG